MRIEQRAQLKVPSPECLHLKCRHLSGSGGRAVDDATAAAGGDGGRGDGGSHHRQPS